MSMEVAVFMPVRAGIGGKDSSLVKTLSAKGLRHRMQGPDDPLEERRLLAAARRGDRRALDLVTRRISGSLHRFSTSFCRNPADAEDVMQEVLASLVASIGRFRGDSTLSSWAYVVARHACARRRRREARLSSLEQDDGKALEVRDSGVGPEQAVERMELREALEQAIAALPASLRDVLQLRDVEGLPAAQVARQLGLGERAVKSRLHRARIALRERLAPYVDGDRPRPAPDCPDVVRMFSRFLEGELDADACARLEGHVAACAGCSAACSALRSTLGACVAWRNAPVPPRVKNAVRAALREVLAGAPAHGDP
jgi:RNA polymerase sigma-70 factor (ECF subfamily)